MNPNIIFFGTPDFSVTILEELFKAGHVPVLIVTAPDTRQGRGLALTPPPVKKWARDHNISYIQPSSLKETVPTELTKYSKSLFIVAAYGKILPKNILEIPEYGTLNVHPSLLPKYRGASPIEGQILSNESDVGVSIMEMDEDLDHGPVVAQEEISLPSWPIRKDELTRILAQAGGALLARILPAWVSSDIKAAPQNHSEATFTEKIKKHHGDLDFTKSAQQNYLQFCAYHPWPGTYFFATKDDVQKRIKVTEATYTHDEFLPTRVISEGKGEMSYSDFLKMGYELPIGAPREAP